MKSAPSTRHEPSQPATTGPLVFQYETPQGHRYHVAGSGFTAEHLRDATRYPADPSAVSVEINPFIPEGSHLKALALVEIEAIEETAIRASWGGQHLVLSPTNFFSEAFAIIAPQFGSLLRRGGTPFGPTLIATEAHGAKERGAIFSIIFLLPPGVDELLNPLPPFGAETPRQILSWIHLLGFRLKPGTENQNTSTWQRDVGGLTLRLETSYGCQPESVSLLREGRPVVEIHLAGFSFTHVHPYLRAFIASAKTTEPAGLQPSFEEIFSPLSRPTPASP